MIDSLFTLYCEACEVADRPSRLWVRAEIEVAFRRLLRRGVHDQLAVDADLTAAVRGPSAARRASISTRPSGVELTVTVLKPAIEAVAGLVPWAVSGIRTFERLLLRASCQARITSIPASSPWAPAAGCRVTRAKPETSAR